MNPRRQQVEVGRDIGNGREKDETCKDKTSMWTESTRTRYCGDRDLQGRHIVVVNIKDETSTC